MKKEIILLLSVIVAVSGCETTQEIQKEKGTHDHSVEFDGRTMKQMTVQKVAKLWDVNSQNLLQGIISVFNLEGEYTTDTLQIFSCTSKRHCGRDQIR